MSVRKESCVVLFEKKTEKQMDCFTIKLLENKGHIPLDIIILINGFIRFEKLNNENIREAVR